MFKVNAAARNVLTKPANVKKGKRSILVARNASEVWHTDGCYIKRGEVPESFGDVEQQGHLTVDQVMHVIPRARDNKVTIVGKVLRNGVNCTVLDNRAEVFTVYLEYVCDDIAGVELFCDGPLHPVVVVKAGDVVGVVMPRIPH
jgi:hypothetical protein